MPQIFLFQSIAKHDDDDQVQQTGLNDDRRWVCHYLYSKSLSLIVFLTVQLYLRFASDYCRKVAIVETVFTRLRYTGERRLPYLWILHTHLKASVNNIIVVANLMSREESFR